MDVRRHATLNSGDPLWRSAMAGVCDICDKRPGFGNKVARLGHRALKRKVKGRSRRQFKPNIQTVHAVIDGRRKRLNVCTSCIKAGKVERR
ncbi:large subunit ribosomal protein L28 [Actinopolymorpha rutila]|uniref:Large ribosomal subunit protein bL28 n=2 Tax=Actinopolymorpha rutila TaxID=446787 RepID=A0A852ZA49_9ACTN|nr:large subunit ribosomal protein L28 [Actinopolymorpha rutila]